MLLIVVPIFTLFGIFTSSFIFKKKLEEIRKELNLKDKMEAYRSALIIKLALIEVPSFFNSYCLSINRHHYFHSIDSFIDYCFFYLQTDKSKIHN